MVVSEQFTTKLEELVTKRKCEKSWKRLLQRSAHQPKTRAGKPTWVSRVKPHRQVAGIGITNNHCRPVPKHCLLPAFVCHSLTTTPHAHETRPIATSAGKPPTDQALFLSCNVSFSFFSTVQIYNLIGICKCCQCNIGLYSSIQAPLSNP